VTFERSAVISFAIPLAQIYHGLFIKNPAESYNYRAYIETFQYMTWIALAVFIAAAPPFLYFTLRYRISYLSDKYLTYSTIHFRASDNGSEGNENSTVGKSYLFTLTAIIKMDSPDHNVKSRSYASRIVILRSVFIVNGTFVT